MHDAALPARRTCVEGHAASFAIERDGNWTTLWRAEHTGARLTLHEEPMVEKLSAADEFEIVLYGRATFAVTLAMAGWPLIRSAADWAERHQSSDLGQSEGLAYKIELFEAVARRDGWVVRTPRVPGLAYRELEEID